MLPRTPAPPASGVIRKEETAGGMHALNGVCSSVQNKKMFIHHPMLVVIASGDFGPGASPYGVKG